MSGDIIKRFIELLAEAQPGISEKITLEIERQMRHEFSGQQVYVPRRDKSLRTQIIEHFNGNNTEKLARELRVTRRTVYRTLKGG